MDPDDVVNRDAKIILSVGRLQREKGFDLLLEAFAQVSQVHPEWQLVVLGAGPALEALNSLHDRLGLKGRVHFCGRVGNVGAWYKRAAIFVLSSRNEGMPNCLMEAMSSGCAVISFDCQTGPRDLIQHETDGLLVPAEDIRGLGEAMSRLIMDDEFRSTLGKNAEMLRERLSLEEVLRQWQKTLTS